MRRVLLYARTSAGDGNLDRQFQALEASLEAGDQVDGSYADWGPATADPPPGLVEALDHLAQGNVDALLVQRLDRLARSPEELERIQAMLQDRGVTLVLAQS